MDKNIDEEAIRFAQELLTNDEVRRGRELTQQEEQEYRDGLALAEMVETAGWRVLKRWFEDLSFHSWVDPRQIDGKEGLSKQEWEWRELNAFHAANNAKEIIERIQQTISRSDYLGKVKSGEIQGTKGFKI